MGLDPSPPPLARCEHSGWRPQAKNQSHRAEIPIHMYVYMYLHTYTHIHICSHMYTHRARGEHSRRLQAKDRRRGAETRARTLRAVSSPSWPRVWYYCAKVKSIIVSRTQFIAELTFENFYNFWVLVSFLTPRLVLLRKRQLNTRFASSI